MELQAVIMAGGQGTRMSDLTSSVPKPLLPIGNKPLVWYSVNMLAKAGFQEVIVVTLNSIKQAVECAIKELPISTRVFGFQDDLDFDTVDSLRLIKSYIKTDMLITTCDLVTDVQLHRIVDVYRLHDPTFTMMLSPLKPDLENIPGQKQNKKVGQHKQRDFIGMSPVDKTSERILFICNEADLEDEMLPVKQSLLARYPKIHVCTDMQDVHLYIVKNWILDYIVENKSRSSLRSELLPYIVKKQFSSAGGVKKHNTSDNALDISDVVDDAKDLFKYINLDEDKDLVGDLTHSLHHAVASKEKLSCYGFLYKDGTSICVNSICSYVEANRLMAKPSCTFLDEIAKIHPTCKINEKSQMGNETLIGEQTTVDEKCSIKRSVVGRDCCISSLVKISNCVIMDRVKIAVGCNIQNSVICSDTQINERCELKDCLVGSKKEIQASSKLNREILVDSAVMEFD